MHKVHISEKGRLTIPAAIRRQLGLVPGSYVKVEAVGKTIVLTPVKSIMDAYGALHEYAKGDADDWNTVREEATKMIAKEIADGDRR